MYVPVTLSDVTYTALPSSTLTTMDLIDKLKDKFESKLRMDDRQESQSAPDEPRPQFWTLGARDVYRFRKQYGVNLGSW